MRVAFPTVLFTCLLFSWSLGKQKAQTGSSVAASEESDVSTFACIDPYATSATATGKGCEKELFVKRGHPFMFPTHDGIAYGVSSNPDNDSELYFWVDNKTAHPVRIATCCASFLFEHICVFDSSGRRVLSKTDEKRLQGMPATKVCTCSGSRWIAPHTIQLIDSAGSISSEYALKPGWYTISERYPPESLSETEAQRPEGLQISIK
jgi:hypothetical protein